MSLSTFSSRNEWKVIVVTVFAVVFCEVAARRLVQEFSDEQHRRELPELTTTLLNNPKPRILFLGNSLTNAGIDLVSFEGELGAHRLSAGGLCKVRPDGTTLRHWHYVFQRYFDGRLEGTPECVIVTFVRDHLADQVDPRWRRTALNVGGTRQILGVLQHDAHSLEDGAYFLTAQLVRALAHQPDLKDGILRRIIPHFRSETRRLNLVRRKYFQAKKQSEESGSNTTYTYVQLREFIELLKKNDSHGVFCLMPLPGQQSIDENLVEEIESNGMSFLDFRDLASQTDGHYPDGFHMDEVAADIYSRAIARSIARKCAPLFEQSEETRTASGN